MPALFTAAVVVVARTEIGFRARFTTAVVVVALTLMRAKKTLIADTVVVVAGVAAILFPADFSHVVTEVAVADTALLTPFKNVVVVDTTGATTLPARRTRFTDVAPDEDAGTGDRANIKAPHGESPEVLTVVTGLPVAPAVVCVFDAAYIWARSANSV